MPKKQRLDQLLVTRGIAKTTDEAQRIIMAGAIFGENCRFEKPSEMLPPDAIIYHKQKERKSWASRGALKLLGAVEQFDVLIDGLTAIDVGASTGGFTDVLLQKGAHHVYAVDVGYGELAWKLRNDKRVTVLERQNARYLTKEHIPTSVDMIVCDVSFISLRKALPVPLSFIKEGGQVITLIKPQFEVNAAQIDKGGIVTDKTVRESVCHDIVNWFNGLSGWQVQGVIESPIKGTEGNIEYLLHATYSSVIH